MKRTIKNVIWVYRELFVHYKRMRWAVPLYAMVKVAIPLLESAIPAFAIACLTKGSFWGYMVGVAGIILVSFFFFCSELSLSNVFSVDVMKSRLGRFAKQILEKSLTMDYCNVEPAKNQKILSKGFWSISRNHSGVEGMMRHAFELVTGFFAVLTYGSIMFTVHWSVLLIIFVITVVNYLLNQHAVNFSRTLDDERNQAGRINSTLEEQGISLSYGKDIRIYHVEHWFREIFDEQFATLKRCFSKQELRWYFPTLAEQIGTFLRDIILYSILIQRVLTGEITVAEFTFYVGIVAGFSTWMNQFVYKIANVLDASVEVGYYKEAMEIPNVFRHGTGQKPDMSMPVSIEFRDVSFRYEDSQEDILSHLNFRIEAGQKVALVGNNGAGKTTIVKLLCGFHTPTEGEILINGISTCE